jgi:hypothetical protein
MTILSKNGNCFGQYFESPRTGNTKGETVRLTSCLTGLESVVWLLTIFVFICKTD